MAQLGYALGVGVIDERGFVKKGAGSAGVKRQYGGRVGQIENCQVGVCLGYTAAPGQALLDRELSLPQDGCDDRRRRAKSNLPEAVRLATKPHLAQRMLERAWGGRDTWNTSWKKPTAVPG